MKTVGRGSGRICGFAGICCVLVFASAASGLAETPLSEAAAWQAAVARRAESFTLAPGGLPYEQYHIDKEGNERGRETGRMGLSYDETGQASFSVDWAKRGERDFTAERAKRLEKQSSRFAEFLSFITPFDPDAQDKIELQPGTRVFVDGKDLFQYEFRLPLDRKRGLAGVARVGLDGRPHDFRYTLSPMPFYLDILDMRVVFDAAEERLLFGSLNYAYEASFLFWDWKGGGMVQFDDWKRISAPPKI